MIRPGSAPSALELVVLGRVVRGEDPWIRYVGVGTREVSQALSRLRRRGYLDGMAPTMAAKRTIDKKVIDK